MNHEDQRKIQNRKQTFSFTRVIYAEWLTLINSTQRTTRRRIPEDDTLHNHRCENLKSYTSY
jgi:hypothetical protein